MPSLNGISLKEKYDVEEMSRGFNKKYFLISIFCGAGAWFAVKRAYRAATISLLIQVFSTYIILSSAEINTSRLIFAIIAPFLVILFLSFFVNSIFNAEADSKIRKLERKGMSHNEIYNRMKISWKNLFIFAIIFHLLYGVVKFASILEVLYRVLG